MKYEDYKTFRTAIGGKLLEVEIGKVCELANGQAWVKYGDTVVNVTACASKEPRPDIDFFPLSCDYEEKMYAAGKIPGGFIKREGRPSERAVLCSRLMDRPLRPLFPKGFYNDVQVVATVMCVDNDAPSEIAAMIGSVMVSYVRARAEGLGIECKVGLMQRPERVVVTAVVAIITGITGNLWWLSGGMILIAVLANLTAFWRVEHCRKQLNKRDAAEK